MASVIDTVMEKLGPGGMGAIAGQLGVDQKTAENGVQTAVTVLTSALASNASTQEGAASLDSALAKDHDGSILDNVMGFLGDTSGGSGAGILGHVLGSSSPQVQQAVAQRSGLSLDQVLPLLIAVAPLVMGALGRAKKEESLDAGGIADVLAAEQHQAAKQDDGFLGNILGMLGGGDGGGGGGGGAQSSGGGILDTIGGLFRKKGS